MDQDGSRRAHRAAPTLSACTSPTSGIGYATALTAAGASVSTARASTVVITPPSVMVVFTSAQRPVSRPATPPRIRTGDGSSRGRPLTTLGEPEWQSRRRDSNSRPLVPQTNRARLSGDTRRVRRISPAMIVALVALFVSLAGNAGAVTYLAVTSKQIKDGTIQLRDIAPAARTSLRGSPGPQGSRGSRGSRGCRATEVRLDRLANRSTPTSSRGTWANFAKASAQHRTPCRRRPTCTRASGTAPAPPTTTNAWTPGVTAHTLRQRPRPVAAPRTAAHPPPRTAQRRRRGSARFCRRGSGQEPLRWASATSFRNSAIFSLPNLTSSPCSCAISCSRS